jgi:hypothetical protein
MAIIAPIARKKPRTSREIAAIQSASFHSDIDLKFIAATLEIMIIRTIGHPSGQNRHVKPIVALLPGC